MFSRHGAGAGDLGGRDELLAACRLRLRLRHAYGGWVALLPAVVMDYFGGRNVRGIIGILYTSAGIGTLIGPSAVGFVFDLTHSYTLPIWISVGGNILAAIIMAVTARPAAAIPKI